jgi:opacity protein-like surface antigen
MMRKLMIAVLFTGLAGTAAAATVYKWVDPQGQIHYTDRPPRSSDAKVIAVYEQSSGDVEQSDLAPAEETPPADETAGNGNGNGSQDEEATAASQAQVNAVNADVAKARAERCKKSTERYNSYVVSQRLFRTTKDGKRQYLSESELALARVSAKKDMDDACR